MNSGFLLWSGRHVLFTRYHERLLRSVLAQPIESIKARLSTPPAGQVPHRLDAVVMAVTSVNQAAFSRYNPVPAHVRFIAADRLLNSLGLPFTLLGVSTPSNLIPTERFCKFVLSSVREETEHALQLVPANCVVLCSDPALKEAWLANGFTVLDGELTDKEARAHEVLHRIADSDNVWRALSTCPLVHPISRAVLCEHAVVVQRIERLFRDPVLKASGSLSDASRNYATYNLSMSSEPILNLKWADVKEHVRQGLIVDEGCADGALLTLVARDMPDSDLIGIDLARDMIEAAQHRVRCSHFLQSFVHFHQRNLLDEIFAPSSVTTTICNSTTHELVSYAGGLPALDRYVALKWKQLRPGGRLLIRDVVGPEQPHELCTVRIRTSDGADGDAGAQLLAAGHERNEAALNALSTNARFQVFLADFVATKHAEERTPECVGVDGEFAVWRASRRVVCEARAHIDYTDAWAAEAKEQFCALSFSSWSALLAKHGFELLSPASRAYCSAWLIENRFKNRFVVENEAPDAMPTNVVLVAEKPEIDER